MYGNNSNFMIERLLKQKEEIDNLIRNYQNTGQPTPVNNFINTNQSQTPSKDFVEWRILNENEEVDNLYVPNKTLFINDNTMVLKGVDGSLEKWSIQKTYHIDKKDEKIKELENRIKELEMKKDEPTKLNITTRECNKSYGNDEKFIESKSESTTKFIPSEK